ncbi:FAD-binding oxidoreductase [Streptomyces sp. NEAU-sy36]|uniref:FAD-dependent oxidoreductase n=1 Tax=unclassified Streptomyces TaxID=2593676 RepID=UPI0015D577CB|nr:MULTISPECIES: FAD-dependent oxidoreductase [unclassified Streptomyces]QLJ03655.1 FAD-binding oxidoreductase [Streptomyces sp. NEAU-sy36]
MRDVVVVGAGVIGLTCALRLQEKGLRVVVVTADEPMTTTSAVAAAVWYPTGIDKDSRVAAWCAHTFAELAAQAERGVPAVTMRLTRMLSFRQQTESLPWWGSAVPDLRRLEPAELPSGYADGWEFTAPTVEMPLYLPWLLDRFRNGGGELVHQRLDSLQQARAWAPAIVNASGIGARRLCGDTTLEPVRGQLVLVRNPGLHTSLRVEDDPAGYTYIHPRSADVVLGGTFDKGSWDTAPNPSTARAILGRCRALVPELRDVEVTGHRVGLRPTRHGGIRLEADHRTMPGTRLVHNYGHGGAGVTLSWGSATAAAAAVVSWDGSSASFEKGLA